MAAPAACAAVSSANNWFLHARAAEDSMAQVAAFRRGLAENGYIEGETIFTTFQQCLDTVSGIGGSCNRNTQYVAPPEPHPSSKVLRHYPY
jgi:hypothetical protein